MTAISRQKNCFAAIWKEKNVVHKALEEEKKRMTAIRSQKNCFAANWKEKKVVHKSLELEKRR